eukprot:TRINITY_DN139_c0_g3_i2.p1 TRINITY_DN139_c0_g3~~TRINITY_DN139_c0_g3_i2.p1  ORF type:complete len:552 (-),score=232.41 TRINITY_DN139_c0_g3_i2:122-1777(-)
MSVLEVRIGRDNEVFTSLLHNFAKLVQQKKMTLMNEEEEAEGTTKVDVESHRAREEDVLMWKVREAEKELEDTNQQISIMMEDEEEAAEAEQNPDAENEEANEEELDEDEIDYETKMRLSAEETKKKLLNERVEKENILQDLKEQLRIQKEMIESRKGEEEIEDEKRTQRMKQELIDEWSKVHNKDESIIPYLSHFITSSSSSAPLASFLPQGDLPPILSNIFSSTLPAVPPPSELIDYVKENMSSSLIRRWDTEMKRRDRIDADVQLGFTKSPSVSLLSLLMFHRRWKEQNQFVVKTKADQAVEIQDQLIERFVVDNVNRLIEREKSEKSRELLENQMKDVIEEEKARFVEGMNRMGDFDVVYKTLARLSDEEKWEREKTLVLEFDQEADAEAEKLLELERQELENQPVTDHDDLDDIENEEMREEARKERERDRRENIKQSKQEIEQFKAMKELKKATKLQVKRYQEEKKSWWYRDDYTRFQMDGTTMTVPLEKSQTLIDDHQILVDLERSKMNIIKEKNKRKLLLEHINNNKKDNNKNKNTSTPQKTA